MCTATGAKGLFKYNPEQFLPFNLHVYFMFFFTELLNNYEM